MIRRTRWPMVHIPPWQNGYFLFFCFLWGSRHHIIIKHTNPCTSAYIYTWIEIPYESPRTSAYVDRDSQAHALQHTWIEIRMEGGGDNNVGYSLQTYQPCKTSPKDLERAVGLAQFSGRHVKSQCKAIFRWDFTIF